MEERQSTREGKFLCGQVFNRAFQWRTGVMKPRKKLQVSWLVALASLILTLPVSVWAGSIPIDNPSFENRVGGDVPGWTKDTGVVIGIYSPSAFPSVPDGTYVAYVTAASMSQVLTATVHDGYQYILDFYAGGIFPYNYPSYTVKLAARDGGGVDHVLDQYSGTAPSHTWEHKFIHYTADSTYDGDFLKIIVSSPGSETNFDMFSLSYTEPPPPLLTPIPSTLMLLGSGLLGVSLLRRRRKALK